MIMKGPDGVEREVSLEELKDMLADGELVGIQKISTDQNGNQTVTDVYGNQSETNDGLDRSINAFCSSKDLAAFAKLFLFGKIKQSGDPSDEPENVHKGFIETIDFTDAPTTIKLTIDKTIQKVTLRMFARDIQKNETSGLQVYFREWDTDGDKLTLTGELISKEIEKDERYIYFLGALALRTYLKNTGLLSHLKELKGKGSGVIVSAQRLFRAKSDRIFRARVPCWVRSWPDPMLMNCCKMLLNKRRLLVSSRILQRMKTGKGTGLRMNLSPKKRTKKQR